MLKTLQLLFSFILVVSLSGFAQDSAQDIAPPSTGQVIIAGTGGTVPSAPGAVLYDQGQLINDPGGGSGGADRSYIESALGHTLYGWGHQVLNNNSMGDDFTIPAGEAWTIDELITFAYQSFAPTTSTITEVRAQIWDGNPSTTGTVIWGNLTSNIMTSTVWSNIYRTTETAPTNTDRAVMKQTSTIGITLTEGTYWIQWMSNGSLSSGPWCPPVTILGVAVTGDALQSLAGVWGAALNGTQPNGAPFILMGSIVPVELTSFTGAANENNVTLNWATATETNNQGFEIQRNITGEFMSIGFVDGNGTTTEAQNYNFTDQNLLAGSYSYRLKQIDFDGSFEYSDVVEVEIGAPATFSLNQNYPNPFNPSTVIEFNLAVDSRVSLTVFDVLGQEVATLISGNLAAGSRQVTFDASALNSGVYFFRIDAAGIEGTNFSSVKKMILSK
jgi:hypothetical protein